MLCKCILLAIIDLFLYRFRLMIAFHLPSPHLFELNVITAFIEIEQLLRIPSVSAGLAAALDYIAVLFLLPQCCDLLPSVFLSRAIPYIREKRSGKPGICCYNGCESVHWYPDHLAQ